MKNLTAIIGRTVVATMFVVATPAWGQAPTGATTAPATSLTPAQTLFESGKIAFKEERWPDALQMFTESYKLEPLPKTAAWLGRVQVKSGDYATAAGNLELYLREEKQQSEAAKQIVLDALALAKGKIVTVQLDVTPSDATVTIDKQPIDPNRVTWPIYLIPGGHSFGVQKPGFVPYKHEEIYKPGDTPTIKADLHPAVVDDGKKKPGVPPLAIAGFVVSGGLLVTSGITGILANVASQNAADAAREYRDADFHEQYDRSTAFSAVALASLGVGVGVGVAALIHTRAVQKSSAMASAPKMSWIAVPTPGGIVVQGAW